MRALESATGFLRHELAQRLTVRHVPEIEFRLDTSIARGVHVLNLINQVSAESAQGQGGGPASADAGALDVKDGTR
jgi:ribosome-binding factor A